MICLAAFPSPYSVISFGWISGLPAAAMMRAVSVPARVFQPASMVSTESISKDSLMFPLGNIRIPKSVTKMLYELRRRF